MEKWNHVLSRFCLEGTVSEVLPLGEGLINDTYHVTTAEPSAPDYVLQRINHHIFQHVDRLQYNIECVTRHIRRRLEEGGETDLNRKVLQLVPTSEGKTYCREGDEYWRVMRFIPRAYTYQVVDEHSSRMAGVAFGHFQAMLADLPETLEETIPNFHNMEYRWQQLCEAVQADAAGRVASVCPLLDELERRSRDMCKAERLHREGVLPKRICHCDTKVNNMMFDEDGSVLCVIDLDTVMPSFVFSDYGDFLRTAANTAAEDEPDLSRISFRMDIFRAFTQGYLQSARSFLLPVEVENLPYAAALFPYMQCVRFLADYLNGDVYYKTAAPDHNLVRARAQFALLQSVERHTAEMQQYIGQLMAD